MVNGFDIGIAIVTTLRTVTERLGLPAIPLIICTDSYSLYECLVKLGTTKETWQALRMLWIDTYQGPPDIITHDAGTNFASAEFLAIQREKTSSVGS